MLPIHTMIHPTDLSESSDYTYKLACMLAKESKAKLIVIYCEGMHMELPKPIKTDLGVAIDFSGDYKTHDAELKAKMHEKFEANTDVNVNAKVIYGPAVEEILRLARETNCDMIVMGTHGRTGVGRWLLGSVAEDVQRRATCPVLIVKAPAHHEEGETAE